MQQAAEQPPNRSNAVKNKVQKYRMMQEESEMTETNTSGIITAAADIIAGHSTHFRSGYVISINFPTMPTICMKTCLHKRSWTCSVKNL